MNVVLLVGFLGADPELKYTQSGMPVCNARIATSRSWVDNQGNRQQETEWSQLTIWSKRGEAFAKHLKKGDPVSIRGRLKTDSYEDQQGNKRFSTKVVVEDWGFVGRKREGGTDSPNRGSSGGGGGQRQTTNAVPPDDLPPDDWPGGDDIPF